MAAQYLFGQPSANHRPLLTGTANLATIQVMMEQNELMRLVRDALSNLYDYAALETHPLAALLPRPPGYVGSRANYLSDVLQQTIEGLKPPARDPVPASAEWRPYLILQGRYIECLGLRELQTRLSLSERQLRREHSRAIQAITAALWDRFFTSPHGEGQAERASDFRAFEVTREPIDIVEVLQGVARTFERRAQSAGVRLALLAPQKPLRILADRVVLRQVLLSMLNYALDIHAGEEIALGAEMQAAQVMLWIQFQARAPVLPAGGKEAQQAVFETVRYWVRRLEATLSAADHPTGLARLTLTLPCPIQPVVMVVDDQPTAIQMFRRYLSRSNVQVVGVQDPQRVLPLACQLQPRVITLDVMMPAVDGWELLQLLQTHPDTRHIPVIVCSVWDEPELAFSLGAAGFLKKPITQKDLLDMLTRLELWDTSVAPSPTHTSEAGSVRDGPADDASSPSALLPACRRKPAAGHRP